MIGGGGYMVKSPGHMVGKFESDTTRKCEKNGSSRMQFSGGKTVESASCSWDISWQAAMIRVCRYTDETNILTRRYYCKEKIAQPFSKSREGN